MIARPLYLDTSAILRAVVETGTTPEVEERIAGAGVLITSRLSLVEAARALIGLRATAHLSEARLADAERELDALSRRCEIWELTAAVCEHASRIAPATPLRTLDALHLATFLLARRRIERLDLLTVDERLREAAGVV